jgi:hypothetical protein
MCDQHARRPRVLWFILGEVMIFRACVANKQNERHSLLENRGRTVEGIILLLYFWAEEPLQSHIMTALHLDFYYCHAV